MIKEAFLLLRLLQHIPVLDHTTAVEAIHVDGKGRFIATEWVAGAGALGIDGVVDDAVALFQVEEGVLQLEVAVGVDGSDGGNLRRAPVGDVWVVLDQVVRHVQLHGELGVRPRLVVEGCDVGVEDLDLFKRRRWRGRAGRLV